MKKASGRKYEEEHWPVVWEIENTIYASLVENIPGLVSLSDQEVVAHFTEMLGLFGFASEELETPPPSAWMDESFLTEMPAIRQYMVRAHAEKGDAHIHAALLVPELQRCTRASPTFLDYMKARAQAMHKRIPQAGRTDRSGDAEEMP